MDPYANMGCVLKVNASCDGCKMKVMEVLSSICGTYTVTIDAQTGIADINGQVDPNVVLYALAQSGQHAELVRVKLQHPALARSFTYPPYNNNNHYYYDMINNCDYYGCGYNNNTGGGYPINDPYWYERKLPVPESSSFVRHTSTTASTYGYSPRRRTTTTHHHYASLPPPWNTGFCPHTHRRSY